MITTWLEIGLSNALVATVLAALALVCTRRMRPQWAFAVWLLVLAKLLVPPVWNAPLGSLRTLLPPDETVAGIDWLADSDATRLITSPTDRLPPVAADLSAFDLRATAIEAIPLEQTPIASALRWLAPGLACAWAAGTALWIALSLGRIRRFKLLLKRARRAPAHLQEEVRILADQLGLKRVPEVRVARRRVSPLVWALFGRPTILLPAGLLRKLTRPQRTALLMHELAHLRRRDHWTKLVELAAIAFYWWLPTAWIARRHADCAAEHCCDALVVSHSPAASRAYAEALLATIDFLSPTPTRLPLGASGFSQFGQVSRRIEMILQPQPRRPRALLSCIILIAVSLAVLPLSVRTLWAEPPASPAEVTTEPSQPRPSATTAPPETDALTNELPSADDESVTDKALKSQDLLDLEKTKVESELDQIIKKAAMSVSIVETNMKRREAAQRQVEAMEAAYEAGSVTLDQLLESQRRLAAAEMTYARKVCELSTDQDKRRLLLAQAAVLVSKDATENARRTWQKVYTLYRTGGPGGEPQQEAQAREQFYQFKSQLQRVRDQYGLAQDRTGSLTWKKRVPILGPTTSGGLPRALDPPKEDEIIRAVQQVREKESRPAFDFPDGGMLQIITEKIDEFVDPPKSYPQIGRAQLHHVHYKCTMYRKISAADDPFAVIYIDHRHFHVAPEASDAKRGKLIGDIRFFVGSQQ